MVRIKFCGMSRPEDAALASQLGADAVGMIFYEKSARNVSLGQAREVITEINPLCTAVAVVVNPDVSFMNRLFEQLDIQLIQFHGDESPEFCAQFGRPYIKAVRMRAGTNLAKISKQYHQARGLLLDTYDSAKVGGTGRPFDWTMLGEEGAGIDKSSLILAGGLAPGNVEDAVKRTGINTVDVNSGVEMAPGIKDHALMREVVARLEGM